MRRSTEPRLPLPLPHDPLVSDVNWIDVPLAEQNGPLYVEFPKDFDIMLFRHTSRHDKDSKSLITIVYDRRFYCTPVGVEAYAFIRLGVENARIRGQSAI
jgi:hypothetical protein